MKKIITSILIMSILLVLAYCIPVSAATLDTISIVTNKQIIHPEENVEITVGFGKALGAYTFHISYDSNLFEYVSSEGGTVNNTGDKVIITYYDTTGGTSPRENMKMIFKAKSGITTSNPTDFAITAEGLANADASVSYDDITTPIIKNVVVEPQYEDYQLNLNYTGNIYVNEEKQVQIVTSSNMGRYYAHARLIAEATTPSGGTVTLTAIDEQGLEHDIIQSGWGDAAGYAIGGNVNQVLSATGLFTTKGDYTITLKLIDRDNSDNEIASKAITIPVTEKQNIPDNTPGENTPPEQTPEQKPTQTPDNESTKEPIQEEQKTETLPTKLPKTGNSVYIPIILLSLALMFVFFKVNYKQGKH